jgi:hypothetical protein
MKPIDRFFNYVEKKPDGCWVWIGKISNNGYGRFFTEGKSTAAHRYLYALKNGPFGNNQFALHKCDNRPCVNPDHIFVGSKKDNFYDSVAKGRQPLLNPYKTHCKNGHEFSPNNVRFHFKGATRHRACKACARDAYHRNKSVK